MKTPEVVHDDTLKVEELLRSNARLREEYDELAKSKTDYVELVAEECDVKNKLADALTQIREHFVACKAHRYMGDGARNTPYTVEAAGFDGIRSVLLEVDGYLTGNGTTLKRRAKIRITISGYDLYDAGTGDVVKSFDLRLDAETWADRNGYVLPDEEARESGLA